MNVEFTPYPAEPKPIGRPKNDYSPMIAKLENQPTGWYCIAEWANTSGASKARQCLRKLNLNVRAQVDSKDKTSKLLYYHEKG